MPITDNLPIVEPILLIPIERLQLDPNRPRLKINHAALHRLAEEVMRRGILQPLLIRRADPTPPPDSDSPTPDPEFSRGEFSAGPTTDAQYPPFCRDKTDAQRPPFERETPDSPTPGIPSPCVSPSLCPSISPSLSDLCVSVVNSPSPDPYTVVCGELRLRAARIVGLTHIPCLLRDYSDTQALETQLVENTLRDPLDVVDRGLFLYKLYQKWTEEKRVTNLRDFGSFFSLSEDRITQLFRYAKLPSPIPYFLRTGALTTGHAQSLVKLQGQPRLQIQLAREAAKYNREHYGLSPQQLREKVQQILDEQDPGRPLDRAFRRVLKALPALKDKPFNQFP